MLTIHKLKWPSVLALGLASALALAESGTVIRNADLKEKPFLDATSTGKVAAGAQVNIVGRQGSWMQVQAGPSAGWIKLLNVRTGTAAASSSSGIGTLANVVTTGSSGTTVTTGVKGLSKEDIQTAVPNYKEVEKLSTFAVSEQDAAKSAKQVKLVAVEVADIALPTSSSSNSNSGGSGGNNVDDMRRRRP
ncbi:SH3 domain-containing protein [Andreprevotia chitinilytica]|uniref:SH3 domain-containing protein n=1 Tax=Andreprevotia chitinilytica TaxID=396808 RepID=UPI0012EBDA2A|nr:SH3 domain-containing protein [Andreprevotia chitinilytica]